VDSEQSVVARISGAVLLAFGLGIAALAIWIVERQLTLRGTIKLDAAAFVLGFGFLAWFCSAVGFRLAFNRPNRYNSILSPNGWLGLAVCLGILGIAAVVFNLQSAKYLEVGLAIVVAGVFIYGCIRARAVAIRKGRNDGAP
jgi:hypothetical protein